MVTGRALTAILALLLLGAPPGTLAAPSNGDDCDTGSDAPDRREDAGLTRPHICTGVVDPDDAWDWYRYSTSGSAGFHLKGHTGVLKCYFLGSSSECTYGSLDRFVASNSREIAFRFSGEGRYNISITTSSSTVPVVESVTCTPSPSSVGVTVTCTANALEDLGEVMYTLDWGDGATSKSGWVWENHPQNFTHAYARTGEFQRTLTVKDVPRSGYSNSATHVRYMHVRDATGATTTTDAYDAGLGDIGCPLGTPGCAILHTVRGETSVHLSIHDTLGRPVGAFACATVPCGNNPSISFCGAGTLPLTGGDGDVLVRLDEALGPLDCGTALGVATRGFVRGVFR